jgi:hypothetical protein
MAYTTSLLTGASANKKGYGEGGVLNHSCGTLTYSLKSRIADDSKPDGKGQCSFTLKQFQHCNKDKSTDVRFTVDVRDRERLRIDSMSVTDPQSGIAYQGSGADSGVKERTIKGVGILSTKDLTISAPDLDLQGLSFKFGDLSWSLDDMEHERAASCAKNIDWSGTPVGSINNDCVVPSRRRLRRKFSFDDTSAVAVSSRRCIYSTTIEHPDC